ncbi:MAG TPA: hypothetical protein VD905_01115 [Flavobacteriales bacterium]|nr:hypothetical protein [Flavobacteriales bacterium]
MSQRFYLTLALLVFFACGRSGQSTAPGSGARYNNEIDLEWAKKIGKEMYGKISKNDSLTIYNLFKPALKEDFPDFMKMLRVRESEWGKLHSWKIIDASSYVSGNDDTVEFEITVTALYDNNESHDLLTIKKTGDKGFELQNYDFSTRFMYSCGMDALEELKPTYKDYTEAMIYGDEDKIRQMAGTDSVFYDSLIHLGATTFPEGTSLDSVSFESGYMRKYCGVNGEANGIMVYKIYMNETGYSNVIYKIRRNEGETYEMYEVVFDGELLIDGIEDVELAKRISKDVCKIIRENDPEKFFSTFHSELSSLYTPETKKDLVDIVAGFASLGVFNGYYDWHTYRTKDNSMVYFIVVVELADADEYTGYLEMVFKPDENGKYMLVSCHELTQ